MKFNFPLALSIIALLSPAACALDYRSIGSPIQQDMAQLLKAGQQPNATKSVNFRFANAPFTLRVNVTEVEPVGYSVPANITNPRIINTGYDFSWPNGNDTQVPHFCFAYAWQPRYAAQLVTTVSTRGIVLARLAQIASRL